MNSYSSTYSNDYKWPNIPRKNKNEELKSGAGKNLADPCCAGKSGFSGPTSMPPATEVNRGNKPSTVLDELQAKYPHLRSFIENGGPPTEITQQIKNDKFQTTYQHDYVKDGFIPQDNFTELMDIVKASESGGKCPDKAGALICQKEGQKPTCPCTAETANLIPCKCLQQAAPPHKIAWKPTPISRMERPASKKEKKDPKLKDEGPPPGPAAATKIVKNVTEYQDTISKIGRIIIKKKLLYHNQDTMDKKQQNKR